MRKKKALTKDRLIWMYAQMVRIREFEDRVKRTFVEHPGVIRGHTHLGDGAEATIVGAIATREKNDPAMPSYRCHGYPLVLGSSPRKIMAEIYGRKDGLCGGFGGSMHLADPEHHFPGTSGIIGQAIAHATGAALTAQVKDTGQVIHCFFGDGSTKQGAFYESLNLAAVWKLPIVYILENNHSQAYTHISLEDANYIAGDPLSQQAQAFSMPGVTVDGSDPLKVCAAVQTQFPEHEAVEVYGRKAEYAAAKKKDPIPRFRAALIRKGVLRIADAKRIESEAQAEMEDAVQFALASPHPTPAEAVKYVYA